jgi:hypothetical protein
VRERNDDGEIGRPDAAGQEGEAGCRLAGEVATGEGREPHPVHPDSAAGRDEAAEVSQPVGGREGCAGDPVARSGAHGTQPVGEPFERRQRGVPRPAAQAPDAGERPARHGGQHGGGAVTLDVEKQIVQ